MEIKKLGPHHFGNINTARKLNSYLDHHCLQLMLCY